MRCGLLYSAKSSWGFSIICKGDSMEEESCSTVESFEVISDIRFTLSRGSHLK